MKVNKFLVRVELHNVPTAQWHQIYQALHARMRALGFTSRIRADNGRWYKLPHAEYAIECTDSLIKVRDTVHAWVATVWANHGVVAMEYSAAAWVLPLATAAELAA
jgi:hypothetical protein